MSPSMFAQIQTDSLILHYPFIGNANDESNNSFDGVVMGANLVEDRFGNPNRAYEFDGMSSYIQIPNDSVLKPDFPFTVSVWFKVDSFINPANFIFATDNDSLIYSGFWIGYLQNGRISASYGNGQGLGGSNRRTKHSNSLIDTTNWHNVIAVYKDALNIDLYIDCELDEGYYSGSTTNMVYNNVNGMVGRTRTAGPFYHNGKIDDIRLYNDSLSALALDAFCTDSCISSSGIIVRDVCDSLISPDGEIVWHVSGTYFDTISSVIGCDSTITIELTINNSNSYISEVVCDNYISPSGNYTWTSSGLYTDTVNNGFGCDSIITIDLIVGSSYSSISLQECENYTSPSGKYIWTSNGIYFDTLQNFMGCDSILTIDLTIDQIPWIDLGPDTILCFGQSLLLDAFIEGAYYTWQDGSHNSTFTVSSSGMQMVVLERGSCQFRDSIYVEVYALPEISIADTSICLGEEVVFDVSSSDVLTYEWQDGSTDPIMEASVQGWYVVSIYNEYCSYTDSAYLLVDTEPQFVLPEDTFLCENTPLIFDFSDEGLNIEWQDGNTDSFYVINQQGIYSLVLSNSCGATEYTMKVHPRDCECVMSIPTAFSPGNGGENDLFMVYPECNLSSYIFKVFDRWGKQVFKSKNINEPWNGYFQGQLLTQGVYIYDLEYIFEGEQKSNKKIGTISIVY